MSGFENYPQETRQIELELARKGIALGIDWNDAAAVGALARAALDFKPGGHPAAPDDAREMLRIQIFGLAQLMLKVMTASAKEQIPSHGGEVWKTFGRALWREWQARQP